MSLVVSIVVGLAGLMLVGMGTGGRMIIVVTVVCIAFGLYFVYYKRKHGHPWGGKRAV